MALSDPFQTVYEGGLKAKMGIGDAIQQLAGQYAQRKQQENQLGKMLQMFGLDRNKPLPEELKQLPPGVSIPLGNGAEYKAQSPPVDLATILQTIQALGQGGNSGIGLTGATVSSSGKPSFQIGQTPESKAEQEVSTASKKESGVRLNKLKELNKAVDFFDEKISEIPVGEGLQGRGQGIGLMLEGKLGTNPKAAAYMADVDGLRSQIARGLGEVGNLSEFEQKYAINLLPQITDNKETRNQKLKNFRDYIKKRSEGLDTGNKGLSVGTVKSGYRFKGGNPSDKNNWEKVQ